MNRAKNSKRSAAIVGIAVMGSRLMGVVREQIFAFMFGASMLLPDAFIRGIPHPESAARSLFAEGALSDRLYDHLHQNMGKGRSAASAWHLAQTGSSPR